ncbi:hypothetical protein EV127DRAFT_464741 [Xylaria flabelliformis]|nr:hypothetical protein EV127DRAFT_464741 [Xylaria flabelliformis]
MYTVTRAQREAGWNVMFTIGKRKFPLTFAGIYQVPKDGLITFRDVCNELRLCFNFPDEIIFNESGSNDPWTSIAFVLAERPDMTQQMRDLPFVHGELLDNPVPSLPAKVPRKQDPLKYHIVFHQDCKIPHNEPPNGCARHLTEPTRRYDPRYLAPNRSSSDPRVKGKIRRTRLASAPKRPRSGSNSPTKVADDNDTEVTGMIIPRDLLIDETEAKRTRDGFREGCLVRGTCCAVSGQGETWFFTPSVGPGIDACHIVPQRHYNVYPVGDDIHTINTTSDGLLAAYNKTWSPDNGILLDNFLCICFNLRLFSIHPGTLKVRIFVPYATLIKYHNKVASIHPDTDLAALRHHYDMCCIENMAAKKPQSESVASLRPSTLTIGGSSNVGTPTPSLPPTPGSGAGGMGSPAKKRAPNSGGSRSKDASGQNDLVKEAEAGGYKHSSQASPQHYPDNQYTQDSFITPWNSQRFLANVDSQLRRVQAQYMD